MLSLRELQHRFCAAALFGDDSNSVSLGVVGGELAPAARMTLYRNNILGNYRKVLATTYPVVKRLVGQPFFDAASDGFVRAYPSTRGDVNGYGGEFADFLASYEPARELAYLSDVARLEWAIDQANIAADAEPLDLSALASVPPAALAALRFVLHPSARIVISPFPVLRIWQTNQPGYDGNDRVDLDEGADALLVMREECGVGVQRLRAAEHAFLAALANGESLARAVDCATALDTDFDLGAVLRVHVAQRAMVAFHAPPDLADESAS